MLATIATGQIHEATGVSPKTLNRWCDLEVVTPVEGGDGKGNARRFSLIQAVGIGVVQALRNSERGCSLPYGKTVIDAFENVTEEWLLKRFDEGATVFFMEHMGKPVLTGAKYSDDIDVKRIYDVVKKALDD